MQNTWQPDSRGCSGENDRYNVWEVDTLSILYTDIDLSFAYFVSRISFDEAYYVSHKILETWGFKHYFKCYETLHEL